MKVLILGANGMLGSALLRYLARNPRLDVVGTIRTSATSAILGSSFNVRTFDGVRLASDEHLHALFGGVRADVVINCIGIVKQSAAIHDEAQVIALNALLPHRLARAAAETHTRMIQISTDCVFSGGKGGYREDDTPDPIDLYGRSKLHGEIDDGSALTLRTSIVGHEIASRKGLVEWFLAARGPVRGYANAIFSGLPTTELAQAIEAHVLPNPGLHGVWHLSGPPITKLDLLRLLAEVYGRPTEIIPDATIRIDRSLDSSRFRSATVYRPRAWLESLHVMRDFG